MPPREQWNDGSNTFAVAPGKVIVYNRNYVTNRLLEDNGIQVLAIPAPNWLEAGAAPAA